MVVVGPAVVVVVGATVVVGLLSMVRREPLADALLFLFKSFHSSLAFFHTGAIT